jgi:ribosomal-protein-alanine N-acetyltransferase
LIKDKVLIKQETVIDNVICNFCGKEVQKELGMINDNLHITKKWGYFSKKNYEQHEFDLCEDCYDKITKQFSIPVQINGYYI